jgi:hypothetical protein
MIRSKLIAAAVGVGIVLTTVAASFLMTDISWV